MIALSLALLAALAQVPPPADPVISSEAMAAARRLLTATGADDRRGAAIDVTIDRIIAFTLATCTAAKRHDKGCDGRVKANARLRAKLKEMWPEIMAQILEAQERAYARRLSIADMEAISVFAQTPAGRQFFLQAGPAATEANAAASAIVLEKIAVIEGPAAETVQDPMR